VLGSMADMPTDLKTQIDKLEDQFVVTTAKLKDISDHFVSELKKGLSEEGGSIVSCGIFRARWPAADCDSP
jgi:hexokinase